jgi:hypothetical protein
LNIMAHSLEVIAAHRLEVPKQGDVSVVYVGAAPATQLAPDAVNGLSEYVADLDGRDEIVGRATPAWWDSTKPPELDELETCAIGAFDDASRAAMERLRSRTPRTATSGVVLILRGERGGGQRFVAFLKMSPGPVSHTQFNPATPASQAITVANLQNVLPEPGDLRKAALLPNPTGPPLRVVDLQGRDPAGYWLRFLGAADRPRQKAVAEMLFGAAVGALESEGFERQDARALVATSLERVGVGEKPVAPRAFLDGVAAQADKDTRRVWEHAVEQQPALKSDHIDVAPVVVRKLTTEIDTGGGVSVRGPAAQLDRRVAIDQDDEGWFVKVRATREPEPRTH